MTTESNGPAPEVARFPDVQVSRSRRERWRRLWGWVVIGLPLLIAIVSGLLPARAPLPGEFFQVGDLSHPVWGPIRSVLWLATVGGGIGWLTSWIPSFPRKKATLIVDEDHLHIEQGGERRSIARADIEYAHRDQGTDQLVLRLRDGETLRIAAKEHRQQLESLLRPDVRRGTCRVPIGPAAARARGGQVVGWLVFLVSFITLLVALPFSVRQLVSTASAAPLSSLLTAGISGALAALLWPLLARRQLEVGTDGLRIDSLTRRFIPHEAIELVDQGPDDRVRLTLRDGETVTIPTVTRHGQLAEPIRQAARRSEQSAAAPRQGALERRGRSVSEWSRALGSVTDEAAYRERALRIEDLAQVLEDGHASPERRVAAALALKEGEREQRRIRIAADATVDPDLRVALEAAALGEIQEDALGRAQRRYLEARPPPPAARASR